MSQLQLHQRRMHIRVNFCQFDLERSSLSADVCPLIVYILAGVVDGFMSDGDFVAAYFHYLPGLGVILLMMLMIDALRSWWRRFRKVRRLSRLAHH
jgi:hypothetical protein